MDLTLLYGVAFGTTLSIVSLLWLVSVAIRDASIIDIFWGTLFVAMGWGMLFAVHDRIEPKMLVGVLLVTIWGLRLTYHLAMRNVGHGEDRRYALWRVHGGDNWWLKTYYRIYLFQAAIALIVATPLVATFYRPRDFFVINGLGALIWAAGFVCEFAADLQLTRFRARTAGTDAVMDEGLWRFSRHPNYFGDALQWWGLGLFAFAGPTWWALIGPIVMTLVFVYISNDVIERGLTKRRPDYARYVATTSPFFPWRPRPVADDAAESRTMSGTRTQVAPRSGEGDGNQDAS